MEENKMLAEYLFYHRKYLQTFQFSWAIENLEPNVWELNIHKNFLKIADEILSITDYFTAKQIIDLGLFHIE